MKKIFSIGELGKLFNISTQTLRYYDSIGLLKPNSKNDETGYRNYLFDQTYKLACIIYLRKLGYTIKNIDDYMKSRNINYTLDYLKEQSNQLNEQWAELLLIDKVIQRKIKFIEQEIEKVNTEKFTIKEFKLRKYIPLGHEEELYISDSFYFYPTIAFYEGDNKWFGAYIGEDEDLIGKNILINTIPKGKFYCGYHKGPHSTVNETMNKLYKASEGKFELSTLSVNFSIVDQFVESDMNNYITEVQIRIISKI